jgi:AcrR family transcriptional regulator
MGIHERKQRERERRKQKIIYAAKRRFKACGFKDTSIKDIADECDLSPGTIYLYFKTKEDLYASVLMSVFEYLYMRLKHVENQKATRREDRINALTDAMMNAYSEEPKYLVDLFQMLSQKENSISRQNQEYLSDLYNRMRIITEKMFLRYDQIVNSKRKGQKKLSDIFWSTFIGVVVVETGKANLYDHEVKIRQQLAIVFDIFKRGLLLFNDAQLPTATADY